MELTKEFLEMIEDRIPGGRFLTNAALLLGLLAVIALSCEELWKHIVLPVYAVIATAITKGVITRGEFFRFLLGIASSAGLFWLLEWAVKGSRRLMQDALNSSKEVLALNQKVLMNAEDTNEHMSQMLQAIENLEARVGVLEEKP